jgi:hypothetical protein
MPCLLMFSVAYHVRTNWILIQSGVGRVWNFWWLVSCCGNPGCTHGPLQPLRKRASPPQTTWKSAFSSSISETTLRKGRPTPFPSFRLCNPGRFVWSWVDRQLCIFLTLPVIRSRSPSDSLLTNAHFSDLCSHLSHLEFAADAPARFPPTHLRQISRKHAAIKGDATGIFQSSPADWFGGGVWACLL